MLLPALMSLVVAQPQLALPWPCEQTYRCTQIAHVFSARPSGGGR